MDIVAAQSLKCLKLCTRVCILSVSLYHTLFDSWPCFLLLVHACVHNSCHFITNTSAFTEMEIQLSYSNSVKHKTNEPLCAAAALNPHLALRQSSICVMNLLNLLGLVHPMWSGISPRGGRDPSLASTALNYRHYQQQEGNTPHVNISTLGKRFLKQATKSSE